MKYRKISFTNHPILGTVSFDFVNQATGQPYQNIILAGENGIGKTVFLDFLSTFLPANRVRNIGVVHFELMLSDEDIQRLIEKTKGSYGNTFSEGDFLDKSLIYDYDSTNMDAQYWGTGSYIDKNGSPMIKKGFFFQPFFRSIFSRAEINFTPKKISNVTGMEIDQQELEQQRSSENLGSEIKQLIVDINTQDALETQEWTDAHPNSVLPEDKRHPRQRRFTEAFNKMFPTKRLVKVNSQKGHIDVLFEENGKQMSIDNLSSGEKEIVFRGAFMLRDKLNTQNYIALVDEPELSMHPKWEMKILDYYKNLFKDENGHQSCQLFIATHSVHVLKKALENSADDLVIVMNKDVHGVITCKSIVAPNKLSSITSAETTYLAFGIYSVDYHIELFCEYQRRNSLQSIKSVDTAIMATPQYQADTAKYHRHSEHRRADGTLQNTYDTVCCLVRNHIDHPDTAASYTESDLIDSTELLRSLL